MTEENFKKSIDRITSLYGINGRMISADRVGIGHINDTFKIAFADNGETKIYVYQRVNDFVFSEPEIIMNNIKIVSDYIDKKFGAGSPEASMILCFEKTADGSNFVKLDDGFWRVSKFIEAGTYEMITDGKVLYNTGAAFGTFQNILSGLDAEMLTETIPGFHNTKKRTEALFDGINKDICGRCPQCVREIEFFEKHRKDFSRLVELHECGVLPYRVTHNDTKFNNILIDKNSGKPVCVLDLDTVMPGLAAYDFGDAVRGGTNNTAEDETDLSKVGVNFDYYEQFTRGFITSAKPFLTVSEKDSMALAAMTISYELASRFLLDYITGDKYFRIAHEGHNLERAKCQIKLCENMMANYDRMCNIVDKYYN